MLNGVDYDSISHSLGNRILGIGCNVNETMALMAVLSYIQNMSLHRAPSNQQSGNRETISTAISFTMILSNS